MHAIGDLAAMMTSIESLKADPKLHALLTCYAQLKRKNPDVEWHDRVMELPGCDPAELHRLHGLLLASGWIETRVHGDSFRTAGKLVSCYRVTTDGSAILRFAGPGGVIPDEESSQVI
jgi:hypothetical protein